MFNEAETPNEVVVIGEWESVEMAQRFLKESDLQEKMGDAGVTSGPEAYILEEIEA